MNQEANLDWIAPEGAVWVCGACGKYGPRRDTVGDESCFLNAVLCDKPSIQLDKHGRVHFCVALPEQP